MIYIQALNACRAAGRFCGEHAVKQFPNGGFDAGGYFQDWLDEDGELCDGGYEVREWIAGHNEDEERLCAEFCDALSETFESAQP